MSIITIGADRRVVCLAAVLVTIVLASTVAGCGAGLSRSASANTVGVTTTQPVPATGGTIMSQDISIAFPSGWTENTTNVTIVSMTETPIPPASLGVFVGGATAPEYQVSAAGNPTLMAPATIDLTYNGSNTPGGFLITVANVGTGMYVPTMPVGNGIVSAQVQQLGLYTVVALNPYAGNSYTGSSYTGTATDAKGSTISFSATIDLSGAMIVNLGQYGTLTGTVDGYGKFQFGGNLTGVGQVAATGTLTFDSTHQHISGSGMINGADTFRVTMMLNGSPIQ